MPKIFLPIAVLEISLVLRCEACSKELRGIGAEVEKIAKVGVNAPLGPVIHSALESFCNSRKTLLQYSIDNLAVKRC
jgi:hypothetical protein